MPNVLTVNPIYLDTAGATSAIAHSLIIQTIVVIPTGVTWSAILHDASGGDVILEQTEGHASARYLFSVSFPAGFHVSGLYATTLTDCKVLVYTQ